MFNIYQAFSPTKLPAWQLGTAVGAWVVGGLAVLAYRYVGEARR
jgi:hypothetical protein